MIVTVADLLSEADDESPEYWDEVAETRSSVFEDAYQKISKTLYPCYKDLDLELRMSFLYMAAFRRKYDIPVSKLFMLYTAEGINPPGSWDLLNFKIKYFEDFVLKSLVLANQYNGKFKSCRLHSVFWHFCVTEAGNDRFLHVVSCYADGLMEVLENQRRLCIHSNVLFAIKDVYDSIAAISTVHSLLCFGPPHQYQVPICFGLKFLKVVDALTIRLYEFPIGILNLVLLRYLALTYNGKLPASISKLWSLEFLIIHRYMSIKLPGDLSYLPMEIWDMKELKHVQIMGSNLPDIGPNSDAMLEKLRILLDVRAESCTKSILDRIPNLLKLGIQIELTADSSEPSFSFDQISHLEELHSLKCVIVNPDLKPDIVAPPASFSMLPSGLKKVSLSGFGYPWECMRPIALLPKLQELRLKSYAFRGP